MVQSFELKAYSSVFLPNQKNLELGDKIIVHQRVLDSLIRFFGNRPLPYPMTFQLKNKEFDIVSHCGVLEFTSTYRDYAYLPGWMMNNLQLQDGSKISLKLLNLPKVKFVKFQPKSYEFSKIPKPKLTLENVLSKFTCLTLGDTIIINVNNKKYELNVTELKPKTIVPPAGCVIDTALSVDFDEPLEKAPEEKVEQLQMGVGVKGFVEGNGWFYYKLKTVDPNVGLRLQCTSVQGDPDMYVSTKVTNPTRTTSMWTDSGYGQKFIDIFPGDDGFSKNWYYIGINGYKKDAVYELIATEVEKKEEDDKQPKGKPSSLNRLQTDDPNTTKCKNCQRPIPKHKIQMHSIYCERNNWRCNICEKVLNKKNKATHKHCPKCEEVIHPDAMEKHLDIAHSKVKCDCGQSFEPEIFQIHKDEECKYRLLPCKFCKMPIRAIDKMDHEEVCGGKTVQCSRCSKNVPRKKMTLHLALEHNVNPCIDNDGNRRKNFDPFEVPDEVVHFNNNTNPGTSNNNVGAYDSQLQQALQASRKQQDGFDAQLQKALAESARMSGVDMDVEKPKEEKEPEKDNKKQNKDDGEQLTEYTCPYCNRSLKSAYFDLFQAHMLQCSSKFK